MSRCLIFLYFYQTTGELAYMGDIYFVDDGEMRAFLTQKVYMGREACDPPTCKRVLSPFQGDTIFPPFPQDWETPICRLRRGDTSVIKKVVISHIIMIKSK